MLRLQSGGLLIIPNEKNCLFYTIAGITICFETEWKEEVNNDFKPFLGNNGENEYLVSFQMVEKLREYSGEYIYKNLGFSVFPDIDFEYVRRFHDSLNNERPYAITKMNLKERKIIVEYLADSCRFFCNSRNDFFHIGWEKMLLNEDRIILHAACVNSSLGGILFSGPSGIGKSTQAELWCKYVNSRLLNGDRVILHKDCKSRRWNAYGSPYAGSSKCHLNEWCPVRAVVMLKKAQKCSIRRLDIREAFCRVFAQLTINSWDKGFVLKASDWVLKLVDDIPVYELACTPDERSVNLLMEELYGRNA